MSDRKFKLDRPESGFRINWNFSLGNVLTILTILVTITVAYEKLDGRATNTEGQTAELKAAVSTLNSTLTETNLAVRELAVTVKLEGRKTREGQNQ